MTETLVSGIMASLLTAGFVALGGFLVFLKKSYDRRVINFLLNAAAGIMLASTFFTLLSPAVNGAGALNMSRNMGAVLIVFSVLLGFLVIWALNLIVPHEHENGERHGVNMSISTAWLFVFAIAIHKLPEGIAVGVAIAGGEIFNPRALITGIAIQNIPEGLMVAIALIAIGYSRLKAALAASLTGLMQVIGAAIGIVGTGFSEKMIPFGMAMAGGCMLFVIVNEIIPETCCSEKGSERCSWGIFAGFLFMTYIAVIMS